MKPQQKEKFIEAWEKFLEALRSAGHRKLKKRGSKTKPLGPLLDDVIDRLKEDDVKDELRKALNDFHKDVFDFLLREIEYYNGRYAKSENSNNGDTEDADEAIADGKVVKGSVEKIFNKLPGWIKKILEVLNEVLKLIMGGV